MSLFNSVILFVDIYVSTWFTLFVLALTVLHSMFLNDGNVVFSLFKILFKFPRLNFCSCESVCSGLFGWEVFGCVRVSTFRNCWFISVGLFCLLIFDVYYLVDHLFSAVFLSFQPTLLYHCSDLVSKSQVSCLKIRIFLPDLYHSFLISSLCGVVPKIAV